MTSTLPETWEPRDHPAKFLDLHLAAMLPWLEQEAARLGIPVEELRAVDTFGGVGTIHALPCRTISLELEPEWAMQGGPGSGVADARRPPLRPGSVHAWATSPTFANRMADTYDGSRDTCTDCNGKGATSAVPGHCFSIDGDLWHEPGTCTSCGPTDPCCPRCQRCKGTGLSPSKRRTYLISLGRTPSPGSTTTMQWGPAWRNVHRLAVEAAAGPDGFLADGGLLLVNLSNHQRTVGSGANRRISYPPVVEFFLMTMARTGCYLVSAEPLGTPRFGHGQNGQARVGYEHLLVFRRGRPTTREDLAHERTWEKAGTGSKRNRRPEGDQ